MVPKFVEIRTEELLAIQKENKALLYLADKVGQLIMSANIDEETREVTFSRKWIEDLGELLDAIPGSKRNWEWHGDPDQGGHGWVEVPKGGEDG